MVCYRIRPAYLEEATMRRSLCTALAAIACLAAPMQASAQEDPDSSTAAPEDAQSLPAREVCFRGRPLSSCRAFGITEAAFHFGNDPDERGTSLHFSWSYGGMINVTDSDAVGAALMISTMSTGDDWPGRKQWVFRYRRWLVPEVALDVSVGRGETAWDDPERWRYVADVGLSLRDYVGVFAHADGSPEGAQRSSGLRLGSWPGLLVGLG